MHVRVSLNPRYIEGRPGSVIEVVLGVSFILIAGLFDFLG